MFGSFWTVARRSLRHHWLYNILLLCTLGSGMACALVVYLFVRHELGYDTYHEKADRIFRIQQSRYNKNELTNSSVAANYGIGPDMAAEIPEVEAYVNMRKITGGFVYNGELFRTENAALASPGFFKVFSVPLIEGNDSLALTRPFTAVLSESFARKIFKDENPVGKTYRYRTNLQLEITGIYKDMPDKGHMKLDMLMSMATHDKVASRLILEEPWRWDGYYTYILLHRPEQLEAVKAKLPELIERKTGNWLRETDQKLEISLQPLTSIHLYSNFKDEWTANGNYQMVFFLAATAVAILLIAWLTFSSLATVRTLGRSREVGIRKVLGSTRLQLAVQFLFEALLLNLVAFVLAILMVYLSLPHLSELLNRNLAEEWKWTPSLVGILTGALIVSSLLTGSYPAWVMASISPAETLKGKYSGGKRGVWLRRIMVLIPVTATVILLFSILVIYLQMNLLRKTDLGFDMDRLVLVRNTEIFDSLARKNTEAFKKEIASISGIEQVTMVSERPGNQIRFYANSVRRLGAPKQDGNQYRYYFVDENFVETMGLEVLAGRAMHAGYRLEKDVMINKSACELLGFLTPEEAIDQQINFRDDTAVVRAVVSDYFHQSPRVPVSPTFFVYNPSQCNHYMLRLSERANAPLDIIDKNFRAIFTAEAPHIFFLKDYYETQYEAEDRFGSIVLYFSIILIAISCAGLFSISSYAARQRAREIGIRKVMGATTTDAVLLLLKEYVWLLFIAMVAGLPVAWLALEQWLESFTLRLQITPWMVFIPALLVWIIILATVLKQTVTTARTNPAEVLKYE